MISTVYLSSIHRNQLLHFCWGRISDCILYSYYVLHLTALLPRCIFLSNLSDYLLMIKCPRNTELYFNIKDVLETIKCPSFLALNNLFSMTCILPSANSMRPILDKAIAFWCSTSVNLFCSIRSAQEKCILAALKSAARKNLLPSIKAYGRCKKDKASRYRRGCWSSSLSLQKSMMTRTFRASAVASATLVMSRSLIKSYIIIKITYQNSVALSPFKKQLSE